MGDRTTVELTLRKKDYELIKNEPWFEEGEEGYREEIEDGGEILELIYEDVNYGELPFLGELESRAIPYDQRWAAGGDYTAGIRHVRFSPEGEKEVCEYSDEYANPPFFMLERLSAGIPEDHPLICYLAQWRKDTIPRNWENQDEGIRQYRAKKLLAPQTTQE